MTGIPENYAWSWEIVLFSAKCEILRTTFQPRALSSDIRASQKGFIYFILWLISNILGDLRKLCLVQNFSVTGLHKTSLFLWYLLLLPFEIIKKIKTEKRLTNLFILSCFFFATEKSQGKMSMWMGCIAWYPPFDLLPHDPKTAHKIVWKLISGL